MVDSRTCLVVGAGFYDGNVFVIACSLVTISPPPFLVVLVPHLDASLALLNALLLCKLLPPAAIQHPVLLFPVMTSSGSGHGFLL